MKIKDKKITTILVCCTLLMACEGGGYNETTKNNTIKKQDKPIQNVSGKINYNLENINVTTRNEGLKIVTSSSSIKLNETDEYSLKSDNKIKETISLTDFRGMPILMAIKESNEKKVDISLDSTAIAFFLSRPELANLENEKIAIIKKKLVSDELFNSLVNSIDDAIQSGNTCPLDPFCNMPATLISDKIYKKIKL